MTPLNPAVAFEPGVCPEPLPRPVGPLQWIRLVYKNPIAVFDRETFAADFGQLRTVFGNFVLVNEPRFIEHILLTNHRNYSKGRVIRDGLGPVVGDGLVTSEGDSWRRQRRIAAPGFHRQRLAQAAGTMSRLARQRVERWRVPCEKGQPLDVDREMSSLTMEIVARTLFSMDMSESIDDIGRALTTVVGAFGTITAVDLLFLTLPTWIRRPRSRNTRAALARLELAIQTIIAERRRLREAPDDFLSLMMTWHDEETGERMSDKQLRDEVATFFGTGHETTAMALTWTLYLLSRHPVVERELYEEADRVLGDGEATFADVESLSFTRMVVQEAMRLFPPAYSIQRVPLVDDEVRGHRIPAGSFVTTSPYVTHRNPRLWPDPLRFDPRRFAPDRMTERHAFAYIPFGGGPRACIGSGFAMMEAQRCELFRCGSTTTLLPHPSEPVRGTPTTFEFPVLTAARSGEVAARRPGSPSRTAARFPGYGKPSGNFQETFRYAHQRHVLTSVDEDNCRFSAGVCSGSRQRARYCNPGRHGHGHYGRGA